MKNMVSSRRPPKIRPRRRTPGALEWAEDISGLCARATAIGSGSLLVENITGILEFSGERIRLGTRRGPLCVLGRDLALCDVRRDALMIRGRIERVELPCPGGDAPDER